MHRRIGIPLLITGCALILRVAFLENYPGWFFDEGLYLEYSKNMILGEVGLFGANTIQPAPLFLFLSSLWFRLFGVSILAGRILTAILGSLSVFMVFLIGKKLYSETVGILASVLLCVSYSALSLNRLFMLDTGVEFFFLLMLLAILHDLDVKTKKSGLLVALAAGATSIIKVHGLSSIVALVLIFLYSRMGVKRTISIALLSVAIFLIYPAFSLFYAGQGFLWEVGSHTLRSWGGLSKIFGLDILAISGVFAIVALTAIKEPSTRNGSIVLFSSVFSISLLFVLLYFTWWDVVQIIPIFCLSTAAVFSYFLRIKNRNSFLLILLIFSVDYILLRGRSPMVQEALGGTYTLLKTSLQIRWLLRGVQFFILAALFLPILIRTKISQATRKKLNKLTALTTYVIFLVVFVLFPVSDFIITIKYTRHDGSSTDFKKVAEYLEQVIENDDMVIANPVLAFQLSCRAIPWDHIIRYEQQPEIFEWDCRLENVKLAVMDDHWRGDGTAPWSMAHKGLYETVIKWPVAYSSGSIVVHRNPHSTR